MARKKSRILKIREKRSERSINHIFMMIFYKILQEIFFLPFTKFPIIIHFLRNEFRDLFPDKKQKFDRIFEYLTENYLNSEAKFKPSLWSSYTEISDFENFDNSKNFVESLNFVLKKICASWYCIIQKSL